MPNTPSYPQRRESVDVGPPVPPKADVAAPDHVNQAQIRQRRPQPPPKDSKPLPSISNIASKPLPDQPAIGESVKVDYRTTILWIVGFCIWFLLIVVLLPIIMERDAMPGFNRILRKQTRSVIGFLGLQNRER
ncbi:hypothetical protein CC80DRAFT_596917 [Byssothecium circinans]|uniref:Uncharacterized protein n=1 Tax=Byssothecium circinans TaxID=147558 RepID=A0A6A5TIM3_9PLEO|nr:hypothetical protein CC80DRAFT_596917 [Byssothecium circinans]